MLLRSRSIETLFGFEIFKKKRELKIFIEEKVAIVLATGRCPQNKFSTQLTSSRRRQYRSRRRNSKSYWAITKQQGP